MKNKTVIVITGPTASGKTAAAIEAAKKYHTEIISADSRQCFREMNIGVAKPSPGQLAEVKHHFINSHSIHDEVNAAAFAVYAHECAADIFKERDTVIMAGGTGLYIRAFEQGLDDIPVIPSAIRSDILKDYEARGISWLQEEIRNLDPLYFEKGEMHNPQRMMRALEVKKATGKSIREFQQHEKNLTQHHFSIKKYALDVPREELYSNINRRVDQMIEEGLEAEARSLIPFRHLNALQTVGYAEMFDYFDGATTFQQAVEKIKQHTRNYAKRQLTWFRKDQEMVWIRPGEDI